MEKYYIVEKDVENSLGFIHHKGYDNLDQAEEYLKTLKEQLGKEYYEFFIAEMG